MHECVGAVIIQHESVLLGRRSADRTFYPNVWDVFGGHIESGESHQQALERELAEELGIVPTGSRYLETLSVSSTTEDSHIECHLYVVTGWNGTPANRQPQEHSEIRWFMLREALHLELAAPEYCRIIEGLFKMSKDMEVPGVKFIDCDVRLKKLIGQMIGEVAERHLHLDDGFSIVALHEDQPVGIISVYRRALPVPFSETYEGYIDIIEVIPGYRRQGIARRLVEISIERAQRQGFCQLRAWSSEDKTEVIPMWKALGFGLCPATTYPKGQEVRGYFVTFQLLGKEIA